ncbi:MAG: hypothetical protein LBB51_03700 [Zoogloeaceae bacterium]|jgi:hypothetical protein|nr:hypothetical protein [Zoogloeaceae bacterium]
MRIEKAKLPKGTSFVLRSSILEEAVLRAGITTEISLHQVRSRTFFDALFWPPTQMFRMSVFTSVLARFPRPKRVPRVTTWRQM